MTEPPVRTEQDSLGTVDVPAQRLWGAQTERSKRNFVIGQRRYTFDRPVIRALGLVKKAAAEANEAAGLLDQDVAASIVGAAQEVIDGRLDDEFPLVVFQTGSGTQTNMNANEVIANRAIQFAGGHVGSKSPVHPNDHVNRSQSSNDVFPTVMHVATRLQLEEDLFPAVETMSSTLRALSERFHDVVKVGRTHLQDATPVTLGQEIGAWRSQIDAAAAVVRHHATGLEALSIGGTATGTGLNAPADFGANVSARLASATGLDFHVTDDHFASTSAHDAMAQVSSGLRVLAGALMKMANDVRWLSSGPRNGIGELRIPTNEPGSSIMPGKVNPTQAEALLMVVAQVYGNDTAVAFAAAEGNFQLNVYKPVILHDVLDSIDLLAASMRSFDAHCLQGLEPNLQRIEANLSSNLMLVTALTPHIGYDAAAAIAKKAAVEGLNLRDAALASGEVTAEDYDRWVVPAAMTHPDAVN